MTSRLMVLLCAAIVYSSTTPGQTSSAAGPNKQTGIVKADDCGCEGQVLPEILAVVNGVRITARDITLATADRVRSTQEQVIEARKGELDLQINSKLLDAEAKKRQTTTAKLLEEEVIAKVNGPTEAELQMFYDRNKAQINQEFKDVKKDIGTYLRNERERDEAKKFSERLRAAADLKRLVQQVTPPVTPADRAKVLAMVNGERITSGDIENSLRALIVKVQEQVYALRKEALDLKINDVLLEQEAQKRKTTTQAILQSATSNLKQITEADARAFYEEHKDRVRGDFAQTKDQIIEFMREREKRAALTTFVDQLRRPASIQIFLTPPK